MVSQQQNCLFKCYSQGVDTMRLHHNNSLLTVIVLILSLGLISCKDAEKRPGISLNTQDTNATASKPFFTTEQESAIETARSLGVNDDSMDGLWLAFFVDEEPDGSEKNIDDIRFVFQISETATELTFQKCAGAPDAGINFTVSKDIDGNIQLPVSENLSPHGIPAPIDVSLDSNSELDFGSWISDTGTTSSMVAIKIRGDASAEVGFLDDNSTITDLYCYDYENTTVTHDNFITQTGKRAIRIEEQSYKGICVSQYDSNAFSYSVIERPGYDPEDPSSFATFSTVSEEPDTILFHTDDNTLTYYCDSEHAAVNGIDHVTISYDLK